MSDSAESSGPSARLSVEAVEAMTFEQAIERLEDIIERVEAGEIGLEACLAEYEDGARLIARCRGVLDRVQKRVDALTEGADGKLGIAPDGAIDDAVRGDSDRSTGGASSGGGSA